MTSKSKKPHGINNVGLGRGHEADCPRQLMYVSVAGLDPLGMAAMRTSDWQASSTLVRTTLAATRDLHTLEYSYVGKTTKQKLCSLVHCTL
jgi:hypothetical protein